MDIREMAEKALERPDSFFTSDDSIGYTHALTIGVHRDSDVLARSNWEVISKDMTERFDDDVHIHGSRHWAVGWMDQLAVRVHLYPHPYVGTVVSPAFQAIVEWQEKLEEYPVADESAYSEMEYDEALETLENSYNVSTDKVTDVFSYLFDTYSYCSAEEYNEDAVAEAIAYVHDDCQRCGDHRAVMLLNEELTYGKQKLAVCIACAIAFPDLAYEEVN